MAVDLKSHPGLNPEYFAQMEARAEALELKRKGFPVRVPPQPNKYIPHVGAKQLAKSFDVDAAIHAFNFGEVPARYRGKSKKEEQK